MKPIPVLIAVVTLCASIGVISWMSQPRASENSENGPTPALSENPLEISQEGPHPRAVVAENQFNFGYMILGEKKEHTFVIRNEGEAPLKLRKGPSTCKCTLPSLGDDEEQIIAPGSSGEVVLEWTPRSAEETFGQSATIWTNDPEAESVTLGISGEVRRLVHLEPGSPWTVGIVADDEVATFSGAVGSGADSFNVTKIETSVDWISVELTPIDERSVKGAIPGIASAYEIEGTVRPEMAVGRFEERVTLHTDIEGADQVELVITGARPGPFSILGKEWYGSDMTVMAGTVKAADGKSITLSLLIDRQDVPLQLVSVTSDPDIVDVKLVRDEAFPSPVKERYSLTFEIPPGARTGRFGDDNGIAVKLETNRESMAELNIKVEAVIE